MRVARTRILTTRAALSLPAHDWTYPPSRPLLKKLLGLYFSPMLLLYFSPFHPHFNLSLYIFTYMVDNRIHLPLYHRYPSFVFSTDSFRWMAFYDF